MEHDLFCRISAEFAERLRETLDERRMSVEKLARAVGISSVSVYQYLEKRHFPRTATFIAIADRLSCTTDFLLGLKEQNTAAEFLPCPPFSERLPLLLEVFCVGKHRLATRLGISPSLLFYWQTGQKVPTAEHLAAMSLEFRYSVDFILGREK